MGHLLISISALVALLAVLGVPRPELAQEVVPTPGPNESIFVATLPALPGASVPIALQRLTIEADEGFSIAGSSGLAVY